MSLPSLDGQTGISSVRCQISISLDGFVAGPNQSLEHPNGEGGMRLHQWVFATQGGTTFTFVTDGIEAALELAREAAGDQDVAIAGGASAVQQYSAAGLLDELHLHVVPIVLGSGSRLLENVGDPRLEPVRAMTSPSVTHIKYRLPH